MASEKKWRGPRLDAAKAKEYAKERFHNFLSWQACESEVRWWLDHLAFEVCEPRTAAMKGVPAWEGMPAWPHHVVPVVDADGGRVAACSFCGVSPRPQGVWEADIAPLPHPKVSATEAAAAPPALLLAHRLPDQWYVAAVWLLGPPLAHANLTPPLVGLAEAFSEGMTRRVTLVGFDDGTAGDRVALPPSGATWLHAALPPGTSGMLLCFACSDNAGLALHSAPMRSVHATERDHVRAFLAEPPTPILPPPTAAAATRLPLRRAKGAPPRTAWELVDAKRSTFEGAGMPPLPPYVANLPGVAAWSDAAHASVAATWQHFMTPAAIRASPHLPRPPIFVSVHSMEGMGSDKMPFHDAGFDAWLAKLRAVQAAVVPAVVASVAPYDADFLLPGWCWPQQGPAFVVADNVACRDHLVSLEPLGAYVGGSAAGSSGGTSFVVPWTARLIGKTLHIDVTRQTFQMTLAQRAQVDCLLPPRGPHSWYALTWCAGAADVVAASVRAMGTADPVAAFAAVSMVPPPPELAATMAHRAALLEVAPTRLPPVMGLHNPPLAGLPPWVRRLGGAQNLWLELLAQVHRHYAAHGAQIGVDYPTQYDPNIGLWPSPDAADDGHRTLHWSTDWVVKGLRVRIEYHSEWVRARTHADLDAAGIGSDTRARHFADTAAAWEEIAVLDFFLVDEMEAIAAGRVPCPCTTAERALLDWQGWEDSECWDGIVNHLQEQWTFVQWPYMDEHAVCAVAARAAGDEWVDGTAPHRCLVGISHATVASEALHAVAMGAHPTAAAALHAFPTREAYYNSAAFHCYQQPGARDAVWGEEDVGDEALPTSTSTWHVGEGLQDPEQEWNLLCYEDNYGRYDGAAVRARQMADLEFPWGDEGCEAQACPRFRTVVDAWTPGRAPPLSRSRRAGSRGRARSSSSAARSTARSDGGTTTKTRARSLASVRSAKAAAAMAAAEQEVAARRKAAVQDATARWLSLQNPDEWREEMTAEERTDEIRAAHRRGVRSDTWRVDAMAGGPAPVPTPPEAVQEVLTRHAACPRRPWFRWRSDAPRVITPRMDLLTSYEGRETLEKFLAMFLGGCTCKERNVRDAMRNGAWREPGCATSALDSHLIYEEDQRSPACECDFGLMSFVAETVRLTGQEPFSHARDLIAECTVTRYNGRMQAVGVTTDQYEAWIDLKRTAFRSETLCTTRPPRDSYAARILDMDWDDRPELGASRLALEATCAFVVEKLATEVEAGIAARTARADGCMMRTCRVCRAVHASHGWTDADVAFAVRMEEEAKAATRATAAVATATMTARKATPVLSPEAAAVEDIEKIQDTLTALGDSMQALKVAAKGLGEKTTPAAASAVQQTALLPPSTPLKEDESSIIMSHEDITTARQTLDGLRALGIDTEDSLVDFVTAPLRDVSEAAVETARLVADLLFPTVAWQGRPLWFDGGVTCVYGIDADRTVVLPLIHPSGKPYAVLHMLAQCAMLKNYPGYVSESPACAWDTVDDAHEPSPATVSELLHALTAVYTRFVRHGSQLYVAVPDAGPPPADDPTHGQPLLVFLGEVWEHAPTLRLLHAPTSWKTSGRSVTHRVLQTYVRDSFRQWTRLVSGVASSPKKGSPPQARAASPPRAGAGVASSRASSPPRAASSPQRAASSSPKTYEGVPHILHMLRVQKEGVLLEDTVTSDVTMYRENMNGLVAKFVLQGWTVMEYESLEDMRKRCGKKLEKAFTGMPSEIETWKPEHFDSVYLPALDAFGGIAIDRSALPTFSHEFYAMLRNATHFVYKAAKIQGTYDVVMMGAVKDSVGAAVCVEALQHGTSLYTILTSDRDNIDLKKQIVYNPL